MGVKEKLENLELEGGTGFEKWAGKTDKRQMIVYSSIGIGASLVAVSFIMFRADRQLFTLLNVVGALIALGPSMTIRYREYQELREIESRFPNFLTDVVEAINAGQTLPQAIKSASDNEYGAFTPYVQKMAAQIDWGIPFDNILRNMSEELDSKLMSRTISTIIETHRSGGNIGDVLRAVSESVVEIERIREERKSHVYSQMVIGYTIYFVFLGVIIGIQKFLVPTLLVSGGGVDLGFGGGQDLVSRYQFLFQNLIIIQGLFAGLAIGKMSEGSLIAGLKHVVVLLAVGGVAVVLLL